MTAFINGQQLVLNIGLITKFVVVITFIAFAGLVRVFVHRAWLPVGRTQLFENRHTWVVGVVLPVLLGYPWVMNYYQND